MKKFGRAKSNKRGVIVVKSGQPKVGDSINWSKANSSFRKLLEENKKNK